MPRDGSLILSNIRGPTLALVRRGVSPSWALQLDEIDGAAGGDPTLNDLPADAGRRLQGALGQRPRSVQGGVWTAAFRKR